MRADKDVCLFCLLLNLVPTMFGVQYKGLNKMNEYSWLN